jgi:DNA-binding beta-propeller fold protein YncE
VKSRAIPACVLCLIPVLIHAQTIDLDVARSAQNLQSGVQAFHRGFYNDAWMSLEKAVSYQPANGLAQLWLGRAQWKAGYEQEAVRTWQQAVDAGRGSALVREWIRVTTLRRGLGRELAGTATWVVSSELDGTVASGALFKRPTSVRPRPDGSFWIVAFGSNEILHFDPNFRLIETFKGGLEGFDRPYDLLETPDGSLYVSEYGGDRIARLSPRGDKIATFGAKGSGAGQLLGPQYMTLDERGYIWVTDWGNSRVARFDRNGTFMQSIAGLASPTGVAAHEGRLFVSEKASSRVRIFDLSGNALASIGEGTLEAPEGLSFTSGGELLVADGNKILSCNLETETWTVRGDTSAHTKRLVQQSVGPNGNILAVDFDQSKLVLLADVSSLYGGMVVRVERVNALKFPEVYVDIAVENSFGRPVVGLTIGNFIITEARTPVTGPAIALANVNAKSTDVAVLVERSPGIEQVRADAEKIAGELYAAVSEQGRIKAISAAERPTREADFGEARLRFVAKAFQAPAVSRWRFDVAAKMAGDELITGVTGAKRAIVFLCTGTLGSQAFSTYSLTELAAFLKNNGIAFCPMLCTSQPADEGLAYIAAETGGKVYRSSLPGGVQEVVRDLGARLTSVYSVRYRSRSSAGFGEAYIPLEIQVTAQRVSGREESGYYAPVPEPKGGAAPAPSHSGGE